MLLHEWSLSASFLLPRKSRGKGIFIPRGWTTLMSAWFFLPNNILCGKYRSAFSIFSRLRTKIRRGRLKKRGGLRKNGTFAMRVFLLFFHYTKEPPKSCYDSLFAVIRTEELAEDFFFFFHNVSFFSLKIWQIASSILKCSDHKIICKSLHVSF